MVEIALCLAVVVFLCVAWALFYEALHVAEFYPWLLSEADPTSVGVMMTLEEKQFRLALVGGVYLLMGLPFLGGEIALRLHRRKQRRKQYEHSKTDIS